MIARLRRWWRWLLWHWWPWSTLPSLGVVVLLLLDPTAPQSASLWWMAGSFLAPVVTAVAFYRVLHRRRPAPPRHTPRRAAIRRDGDAGPLSR